MANNTNTLKINTTIFINKIKELSIVLNAANQSQSIGQTKEELIVEANKLLSAFYSQLSSPLYKPYETIVDTKPNLEDNNKNWTNILSDLNIIFLELSNIVSIILSNFNFMVSDSNRLMSRLKNIDSQLANYVLYSSDMTKDAVYTSDSFNNLNAIDFNSSLLNSTQCEIDQSQGIVTLPINKTSQTDIKITTKPTINNNSNGSVGNNFEQNALFNGDINSILDNNPDTVFEYEKVIFGADNHQPLILDITLNLSKLQVINYVRINPNNFGTKTGIIITDISSSPDGKHFVSIKDDVPIDGFKSLEEDNIFPLGPSSGKFSGQGIYSFLPREAKYIHFTFKQNTPYKIIDRNNTPRLRYAIGLRDIEIAARPYDDTGEIVSQTYTINSGIKKVAIKTNQTPVESSSLASIEHYISGDNGLSWNRIEAINFANLDLTIPKIINFNTLDDDSYNTDIAVRSIKYKAVLKRHDDGFDTVNPISNLVEPVNELHPVPNNTPLSIKLINTPSDDNIIILDPLFGSRGVREMRYQLVAGNGFALTIQLPFKNIKKDLIKTNGVISHIGSEQIRVNGILWTRGNLGTASPTNQIYEFDYTNSVLKFGDNSNGKAVPLNSTIDIMFNQERLLITDSINPIAILDYVTSNDQNSFTLLEYGSDTYNTELLNKNTNINILKNKYLTSNSVTFSDHTVFATEVLFNNGSIELLASGQYSIDYINGIVYSKINTSSDLNTRIDYSYTPVRTLDNTEWGFVFDNGFNKISINSNSFLSTKVNKESIANNKTYISLKNISLVKGSIVFSGGNSSICYRKEVPFIDGHSELSIGINTIESIGPFNIGLNHYNFRLAPIQSRVIFSNTNVFVHEVSALANIVANGDYYIDFGTGVVSILSATAVDNAGTVSYLYTDTTRSADGLYSVNYNTGEIFSIIGTLDVLVDYNYSHYEAQYNIARLVDSEDYLFDRTENTIVLNEREILNRLNISKNKSGQQLYQIVFNKNVNTNAIMQKLKPYFSPILKDYAIRIITESNFIL